MPRFKNIRGNSSIERTTGCYRHEEIFETIKNASRGVRVLSFLIAGAVGNSISLGSFVPVQLAFVSLNFIIHGESLFLDLPRVDLSEFSGSRDGHRACRSMQRIYTDGTRCHAGFRSWPELCAASNLPRNDVKRVAISMQSSFPSFLEDRAIGASILKRIS